MNTFTDLSQNVQCRTDTRLLNIDHNIDDFVTNMTQTEMATEEDLLVSLTFHNFPAGMLKEFALKIVKPYFNGDINQAIRSLMEKAIAEEIIVNQVIKTEIKSGQGKI